MQTPQSVLKRPDNEREEMVSKIVEAVAEYLDEDPNEVVSLGARVEAFESICRAAESENTVAISFEVATTSDEFRVDIRGGEPEIVPVSR